MLEHKYACKDKSVALYIHIPFCKQKCLYCDFPSFAGKENLMEDYSKALAKEIEKIGRRNIKTIFIGGGTPTYLSLKAWEILKNAIDKLDKNNILEFTVEGNPGTFTEEKLIFLKKMGVNRLSIGLQSYENIILKKIGRIHTIEDFIISYKMARNIGFKNINIDLMFGLPEQSMDDWKETLKKVVEMKPEHISCYSLIIEEKTVFQSMYNEGKLKLPSEDVEREMYTYGVNFLKNMGYEQYEISNFSKEGKQCKHNLIYWNLEEYIGCGSGAHSYIDGVRYRNYENIEKYIENIEKNIFLRLDEHKNSLEDTMEEFMFMGLRKIEGISIKKFNKKFNKNIYDIYGEIIKKYLNINMLINKDDRLFLSARGIEVSNSIMCDFILT